MPKRDSAVCVSNIAARLDDKQSCCHLLSSCRINDRSSCYQVLRCCEQLWTTAETLVAMYGPRVANVPQHKMACSSSRDVNPCEHKQYVKAKPARDMWAPRKEHWFGAPGKLKVWYPFRPILFKISRPRTGLVNIFDGSCPNWE